MKTTWFPGRLVALNEGECRQLLSSKHVGRVAWNDANGPVVLPVNYVLDDAGDIRFRTEPGTALAFQVDNGTLTFQLDEFDELFEAGWSVLIRGSARYVHTPPQDDEVQPEPWAGGERDFQIRLTPRIISGRRILPA